MVPIHSCFIEKETVRWVGLEWAGFVGHKCSGQDFKGVLAFSWIKMFVLIEFLKMFW